LGLKVVWLGDDLALVGKLHTLNDLWQLIVAVKLIFNTAKYQGIDYKRQSALEKRLGTTFC
jgi:hypothetical protein